MRTEFKFRDVIHGYVKLDKQEIEIVNSPEYQRLRRIRQLSLTEMVYPGANHTRFEHSLGVLQLATEIFDNIIKQEHSREILGFKNEYDSRIYRLRKIIRLAALLHDIGHAPFSHTSEELMPFLSKNKKGRKYKHEDYSFAIIKTYFK
ncbi:MAG: HD domain-containing protein, partial [Defluviitaleaceae bacterium]|nr:HD domain-containing protein [Defluviitaleaceae bacterium]